MMLHHLAGEVADWDWLVWLTTLVPVLAAWRLAKFNLGGQESTFEGLPTPAYAIWTVAFVLIFPAWIEEGWALLVWLLATPWVMVAPIPLIALKFQGWSWQQNWHRYMVLSCGLIALPLLGWAGIVAYIPFYIVFSIIVYERNPKS